jgi:hypothetical protein
VPAVEVEAAKVILERAAERVARPDADEHPQVRERGPARRGQQS